MKVLFVAGAGTENFARHYTFGAYFDLIAAQKPKEVWGVQDGYDVVIYEWANKFTFDCLERPCQGVKIVRAHDHEITKGVFEQLRAIDYLRWSSVDYFWFINKQVMGLFLSRYSAARAFYFPNAIDASRYSVQNATKNKFKVALISIHPQPRKRMDRAIDLMRLLPNEYELHIMTDPYSFFEEKQKLKERAKDLNVHWHDRDAVLLERTRYTDSRVVDFLKDANFVLSTSEHEAFGYTIAEGILMGCIPVVYNWEFGGARDVWGDDVVFDTIEQMANFIVSDDIEKAKEMRKFVLEKYAARNLAPRLWQIFFGFTSEIAARTAKKVANPNG